MQFSKSPHLQLKLTIFVPVDITIFSCWTPGVIHGLFPRGIPPGLSETQRLEAESSQEAFRLRNSEAHGEAGRHGG